MNLFLIITAIKNKCELKEIIMKTIKVLSLVVITALAGVITTGQALATENSPHSIGAQLSGAAAKYKGSSEDDNGIGQVYLHYNYALNEIFSVEVGLNSAAEIDDWQCSDTNKDKFTCAKTDNKLFGIDANEIEYNNFVVAAKGHYSLTERHSLYGKVGVQFYDYELSNNNKVLKSDDGVGLFLEAGWQYQWDGGLRVNAGLQSMKMGDLEVAGTTLGLSYQF